MHTHAGFLCSRGFLLSGMFRVINVEAYAAHGRMASTIVITIAIIIIIIIIIMIILIIKIIL